MITIDITCTAFNFSLAAFPFYHLNNIEVIFSVNAGERMAQPEDCPDDVYVN